MITITYKFLNKWLRDEGYNPYEFTTKQKKAFIELCKNGPMTYKQLENKLKISRTSVYKILKPFLNIGWVIIKAILNEKNHPVKQLHSIYKIGY